LSNLHEQGDSGRKVGVLVADKIGHYESKKCAWTCVGLWMVGEGGREGGRERERERELTECAN
jgi:hypothetical protein